MAVLRLLVRLIGITLLATSAACTDSPVQQTALVPTAPTPAISSALMTAPVKGVVREVNAGPLAGATVRLVGTAQPRETQTDQNGHFQLPSVESAPGGSTSVIISHNGFFSNCLLYTSPSPRD